jgi:hypothetical protein
MIFFDLYIPFGVWVDPTIVICSKDEVGGVKVYIANINLYHVIGALLACIAFWVHNYIPHDENWPLFPMKVERNKIIY